MSCFFACCLFQKLRVLLANPVWGVQFWRSPTVGREPRSFGVAGDVLVPEHLGLSRALLRLQQCAGAAKIFERKGWERGEKTHLWVVFGGFVREAGYKHGFQLEFSSFCCLLSKLCATLAQVDTGCWFSSLPHLLMGENHGKPMKFSQDQLGSHWRRVSKLQFQLSSFIYGHLGSEDDGYRSCSWLHFRLSHQNPAKKLEHMLFFSFQVLL